MRNNSSTQRLFDRYLHLLGTSRRDPSNEALTELVAAHVARVPFENISKLYYRSRFNLRTLPGLERFLDGIEHFNFGGTCYTNNIYFNLLLSHLGYDVNLCGADMINPDVHIVNIVLVDEKEYLVDMGYAAPFFAPFPRDLERVQEIILGRERYVFNPQDSEGRSRMDLYRDGHLKHGYLAKPVPRSIEYFGKVIADSFTERATFMNAILIVRFLPEQSFTIHNLEFIEAHGTEWNAVQFDNRDDLAYAVEEYFAIPRSIVAEAIGGLERLMDPWS